MCVELTGQLDKLDKVCSPIIYKICPFIRACSHMIIKDLTSSFGKTTYGEGCSIRRIELQVLKTSRHSWYSLVFHVPAVLLSVLLLTSKFVLNVHEILSKIYILERFLLYKSSAKFGEALEIKR